MSIKKKIRNNIEKGNSLKLIIQFIKFGIVGLSNTIISLAFYYFCIYIGLHYILANFISFVAGVINAYYWNSRYVFKNQVKENMNDEPGGYNKIKSIIKVFISYGITLCLSTILLYVWVDILNISDKIAPIINLVITIPLNFILNKFWAFQ